MELKDVQGPLQMQEEWFGSLFDMLDRVFRQGSDRSMQSDFPFYLSRTNACNLFVCTVEGSVVCHAGYLPVTLSFFGHPVRIGMVGAVATDPQWRGRALATKTMCHLFSTARRRGLPLLMISGSRGLYQRLGAKTVGAFPEYRLPARSIKGKGAELQMAGPQDAAVMSALHRKKPYRFIRPIELWEKLIESQVCHNHHSRYWLVKDAGETAAYFTLPAGRAGEDGLCRVYEYGGAMEHVIAGLAAISGEREDISHFVISAYAHETAERRMLQEASGSTGELRPMHGTLRVLDFELLLRSLTPYIEETAGSRIAGELCFSHDGGERFTISRASETFRLEGYGTLADFLFNAGPAASADALQGKKRLAGALERFLPLTAPKYDMSYA